MDGYITDGFAICSLQDTIENSISPSNMVCDIFRETMVHAENLNLPQEQRSRHPQNPTAPQNQNVTLLLDEKSSFHINTQPFTSSIRSFCMLTMPQCPCGNLLQTGFGLNYATCKWWLVSIRKTVSENPLKRWYWKLLHGFVKEHKGW